MVTRSPLTVCFAAGLGSATATGASARTPHPTVTAFLNEFVMGASLPQVRDERPIARVFITV